MCDMTINIYGGNNQILPNATDLAQVVVSLLDQESKLTEETIVKESFIQCLLPFAINITTGRSVNNIRARINDALIARRKSHPKH